MLSAPLACVGTHVTAPIDVDDHPAHAAIVAWGPGPAAAPRKPGTAGAAHRPVGGSARGDRGAGTDRWLPRPGPAGGGAGGEGPGAPRGHSRAGPPAATGQRGEHRGLCARGLRSGGAGPSPGSPAGSRPGPAAGPASRRRADGCRIGEAAGGRTVARAAEPGRPWRAGGAVRGQPPDGRHGPGRGGSWRGGAVSGSALGGHPGQAHSSWGPRHGGSAGQRGGCPLAHL